MPAATGQYRGRFAPSPTGPLHLGSLIAALASYLDARRHNGAWLVRMEDLDPPREDPGAARRILHSLQCHGLQWDEEVMWQGQREAAYQDSLDQLKASGLLFYCDCTRARQGPGGACQGDCQSRQAEIARPHSTRIRVPADCNITFTDSLQGVQSHSLGRALSDFVVVRKDGLFAYQLAVVVDDSAQGISHVVRGSDLLDSTPRQIFLLQLLNLPVPKYSHLPVITNPQGQKFSKQNHAPALDDEQAETNLRQALRFLRQQDPPENQHGVAQLLAFAVNHWSPALVPATLSVPATVLA